MPLIALWLVSILSGHIRQRGGREPAARCQRMEAKVRPSLVIFAVAIATCVSMAPLSVQASAQAGSAAGHGQLVHSPDGNWRTWSMRIRASAPECFEGRAASEEAVQRRWLWLSPAIQQPVLLPCRCLSERHGRRCLHVHHRGVAVGRLRRLPQPGRAGRRVLERPTDHRDRLDRRPYPV